MSAATADLIRESVDWLLERIPTEHRTATERTDYPNGRVLLRWFRDPRALALTFESPHRVLFSRRTIPCGERTNANGKLLLSLNIREILDLIAWCHGAPADAA